MDIVRDIASLDPELLQLPEVSQLVLKEKPKIAEELFCQWLSLLETGKLVRLISLTGFMIFDSNILFHFPSSARIAYFCGICLWQVTGQSMSANNTINFLQSMTALVEM